MSAGSALSFQASTYDEARGWLQGWPQGARIAVTYHGDADGTGCAALAVRYIERSDRIVAAVLAPGKGQNLFDAAYTEQLAAARPDALLVLDQGSSARAVLPGVPTLIVDHHDAPPEGVAAAVYVSGLGENPVPAASLMTYRLLAPIVNLSDVDWYAAVGTIGDLGADAAFPEIAAAKKRWGQKNLTEVVALVNAAKRAAKHDTLCSLHALLHAESPADIAQGMIEEYDAMSAYRIEVQAERARCAKAAPHFANDWALVRITSACQIHGPIASSWVGRLPKYIVIAANDGYTKGNVHFSIRTRRPGENLLTRLRAFRDVLDLPDLGQGHAEATGGILPRAQFDLLLHEMGFTA